MAAPLAALHCYHISAQLDGLDRVLGQPHRGHTDHAGVF